MISGVKKNLNRFFVGGMEEFIKFCFSGKL